MKKLLLFCKDSLSTKLNYEKDFLHIISKIYSLHEILKRLLVYLMYNLYQFQINSYTI